jgi:UDP-glucose 4-epimerase
MKFVITGSSGFIGYHLSDSIDGSIPFDLSHENAIGNGDITILDNILNASKNCDGIIHLAAISRVSDCEHDPKKCIDVNINGTLNVLQAAIKNNIKWVGIITTGEVQWIENNKIQSFNKINNVYGVSKLASELLVDVIGSKAGLKSTIFRISSVVFGEGDNPKKVFPLFVSKSINGEDITINDCLSEWDFIYVGDVVNFIKKSAFEKNESKSFVEESNIFSGIRLDLLSLAKIINYLTGSSSKINYQNQSIEKVTNVEFNKIVTKRKLSEKFLNQVKKVITYNLREIENIKNHNLNK